MSLNRVPGAASLSVQSICRRTRLSGDSPMLVIRDEQMHVIKDAMLDAWIVKHLGRHFADETAGMNDRQILRLVRQGRRKACLHGFSSEAHACRYIDLMVMLGPNFDVDPRMPWAAEILAYRGTTEPGTRIEMLLESACKYLDDQDAPCDKSDSEERA